MTQKGSTPVVIVIVLTILLIIGGASYFFKNSFKSNTACIPTRIGLEKNNSHIFLNNTSKSGYEAIVRKKVEGESINFDIVTNMLPDSEGPFQVWVVNIDSGGRVCSKQYLGSLTQDKNTSVWTIAFDSKKYTDDSENIIITSKGLELGETLADPAVIFSGSFAQTNTKVNKGEKPTPAKAAKELSGVKIVTYRLPRSIDSGLKLMNGNDLVKDFEGRYSYGEVSHGHNLVAVANFLEATIYDSSGNLLNQHIINDKEHGIKTKGISAPSWSADDNYLAFIALTDPQPLGGNNYMIWLWDKQKNEWSATGDYGIGPCYAICYPVALIFSPTRYQYLWLSGEKDIYLQVNSRDNPVTKYSSGCPWACGSVRYKLPVDFIEAREVDYKWADDGEAVLFKIRRDSKDYTKIPLSDFKD